jgi:HD superfamily phosphohydrolase
VHGQAIKIADAVHGTVPLTALEGQVLDSQVFQRLRGIRHLGLASLVFPGADFSRLAHGIGTCHVTGRILSALQQAHPDKIDDGDIVLYRLAALLHDVGHYPFSHTFEHALDDFNLKSSVLDTDVPGDANGGVLKHEDVGTLVIAQDDELVSILEAAGIESSELSRIITRKDEPPKFTNLVSSDLDADRIDYLLRTARHTGLPYGNVDFDYLLTQIRLDAKDRICYLPKGMRAAEHLLLCRFFDYAQVSFHKSTAALEIALNEAIAGLLENEILTCTPASLESMIAEGAWRRFDDSHVLWLLRTAVEDNSLSEEQSLCARSVLQRRPPKMIFEHEAFGGQTTGEKLRFLEAVAKEKALGWEASFGHKIWIWSRPINFTKIGPSLSLTDHQAENDETYDRIKQAVLIQEGGPGTEGVPIQEVSRSLMPTLTASSLYAVRVYAMAVDVEPEALEKLRSQVAADLTPYV